MLKEKREVAKGPEGLMLKEKRERAQRAGGVALKKNFKTTPHHRKRFPSPEGGSNFFTQKPPLGEVVNEVNRRGLFFKLSY